MRLARVLLLVVLFVAVAVSAQDAKQPNGISVGKPKVFDNRTLTIMLESLSQTLQGMQFVDRQAIANGVTSIQGFRSRDVNSSFLLNPLPIPSQKVEETVKTGNVIAASGAPLPDTTDTKTTTDRAAFTPSAPTLADAPAFSGFTPNFGQSAGDLLSEQINLTYQIFNLRMILERALSDRLIDDDPRMQAVLGFNVTLDPPRTAVDAVAVVEVTLHAADNKGLSLVALMPQEKTYNSATLSTKQRAFGGSAVVNMMQVGFTERRRGQTFFLYRDNDTISYERMKPENENDVVFGWMFRPVLGRRSVSPGFRQMFAVVSLPKSDLCTNDQCPEQMINATVKTYWKRYDAGTLTSFENRDANRAERFRYAATLGLTKPQIFQERYRNEREYKDIAVKATSKYERNLGPKIERVSWSPVGAKSVLISAVGKNFFTGTQVILGDKKIGTAEGLVVKSNNAFELVTTMDSLSTGPGIVSGRYGPPVAFIADDAANADGIAITGMELGPSIAGTRTLMVTLGSGGFDRSGTRKPLTRADLPHDSDVISPLVTVNGNTMPLPYQLIEVSPSVIVQGTIPDSFVPAGNAHVKVSWPFQSDRWTSALVLQNPAASYEVVRISDKSFLITAKDEDAGFLNRTDNPKTPLVSVYRLI